MIRTGRENITVDPKETVVDPKITCKKLHYYDDIIISISKKC